MKNYQCILLDWDGNIAKTLDIWLEALKAPLRQRGYNLSDVEIGANFAAFRERAGRFGICDIDDILAEADFLTAQNTPSVELYPSAVDVLRRLHEAGKQLALITTSTHLQIDGLLEKYGLAKLFDAIVCGDDVTHHKPHPEPIKKALKLLNASATSAIMMGDSDKDINAAKNAGVDSILFYPPAHERFYDLPTLKKLQPTCIAQDFHDIISIIQAQ